RRVTVVGDLAAPPAGGRIHEPRPEGNPLDAGVAGIVRVHTAEVGPRSRYRIGFGVPHAVDVHQLVDTRVGGSHDVGVTPERLRPSHDEVVARCDVTRIVGGVTG